MSRIAQNQLTLEPHKDGFRLFGNVLGKKIRRFSRDLAFLETLKATLLKSVTISAAMREPVAIKTYLPPDPAVIRSLEALWNEFKDRPRPIIEYARAGLSVLGDGARIECELAMTSWEAEMRTELQLREISINSNLATVEGFLKQHRPKYLDNITPAMIENWGSMRMIRARNAARGASPWTKIGRLSMLRTFLNFCVAKRLLAKSPFDIDMKKLRKQAGHHKERALILSAAQCEALLHAAITHNPRYVPYVILATWCFMRSAEAQRCMPEQLQLDRPVPFVEPEPHKVGTAAYRKTNIPANLVPLLRECLDSGLWPAGTPLHYDETSFKTLRAHAGLLVLGPRNEQGYRAVSDSVWQPNILRHTGISYLYQSLADRADRGEFNEDSVIAAVTRQAGNSEDVAFRHYINLPSAEEAAKFFAITGTLNAPKIELAHDHAQNVA